MFHLFPYHLPPSQVIDCMVEASRTNMMNQLRSGPQAQQDLMNAADVILNLFALVRGRGRE